VPNGIVIVKRNGRVQVQGNSIPDRKAFSTGLSSKWIKTTEEVYELPWDFHEYLRIGNWYICHGTGMQAVARARALGLSVMQFHYHSKFFAQIVDAYHNRWAVQGGCLVDHNSYAMAYAKAGPPMAKGVTVIKDIGGDNEKIILRPFK
jgi:hypothetical protein